MIGPMVYRSMRQSMQKHHATTISGLWQQDASLSQLNNLNASVIYSLSDLVDIQLKLSLDNLDPCKLPVTKQLILLKYSSPTLWKPILVKRIHIHMRKYNQAIVYELTEQFGIQYLIIQKIIQKVDTLPQNDIKGGSQATTPADGTKGCGQSTLPQTISRVV